MLDSASPSNVRITDSSWLWHAALWVTLGVAVVGVGTAVGSTVGLLFGSGSVLGVVVGFVVSLAFVFLGAYLLLRGVALLVRAVNDERVFAG